MKPDTPTAKAACRKPVVLVVRHAELLAEALQIALQFRSAALAVSLCLLEPAVKDLGDGTDLIVSDLKTLATPCFCNHGPTAVRLGISYSSIADIAALLDAAHWVLTF
jgi:hypothetical protein